MSGSPGDLGNLPLGIADLDPILEAERALERVEEERREAERDRERADRDRRRAERDAENEGGLY